MRIKHPTFRIILIGIQGVGKSSLRNLLLQEKVFNIEDNSISNNETSYKKKV